MNRIKNLSTIALCLVATNFFAQTLDPVLMRINGVEVTRSEFEYALNKNNSVLSNDKTKEVLEYLPMYIDFKLKVTDALAQSLDTLSSFIEEYKNDRAQIAESYLIDRDYIESEAYKLYRKDSTAIGYDGFLKVAHIMFPIKQNELPGQATAIAQKADSVYSLINNGVTFEDVANTYSPQGSEPFEILRTQSYKEFETTAFALKDNQVSPPFSSPAGIHIVKRYGIRPFGSYAEYYDNIISILEGRNIRKVARLRLGLKLAKEMGGNLTAEEALAIEDKKLEEKYPEFKNLSREYFEGLLFFEISNREVWNKASIDEKGLAAYFKKNKKKYKFDTPRFRGAVIYATSQENLDLALQLLKKEPIDKYKQKIDEHFTVDSVSTVRVETGVYAIGENGWVDKDVFEQGQGGTMKKGYTHAGVTGVLLKKGPETFRDVRGLVTNDYQQKLEKEWLKRLHSKYKVVVNEEILKTVNNHN